MITETVLSQEVNVPLINTTTPSYFSYFNLPRPTRRGAGLDHKCSPISSPLSLVILTSLIKSFDFTPFWNEASHS